MTSPNRHRLRNVLLALGGASLAIASGALPAHARTVRPSTGVPKIVPRAALTARPPPELAPGSPGTIGHAIAAQEKKRRYRRQQTEGTLPEREPDGVCALSSEMANVDQRFCIDRFEASLLVDDDGVTGWEPTSVLDVTKSYRAVSVRGVYPQAYVSGEQAEAACKASGKRLCNASEWRLACSGSEGTIYPYGPRHIEGRCNDHGRAPMYVFYPQVEKSWSSVTNTDMNDPRLDLMENTVAKTGEHAGCVNDWGVYDMVGNLHEWVSDPYGTFQGGYYLDTSVNGEGCAYRTTAHDFDYHDYSTGFRCCADLRLDQAGDHEP